MNTANDQHLLVHPKWRAEDLGQPLPDSPHANSVCLPEWQDIIDYEEKNPRVINRLQAGYPRFVIPKPCAQYFEECRKRFGREGDLCHAYPTERTARRAAEAIERWSGAKPSIHFAGHGRVHAVCFPADAAPWALKYWRHCGEGISSRQAAALLDGRKDQPAIAQQASVIARISTLTGVPGDCVYLFKSGMAAIFALYRALSRMQPGGATIQYGFPYVDTLKIQQSFGHRSTFFPLGTASDLRMLSRMATIDRFAGLFTEFPSNPLLNSPDLAALARASEERRFPIIVDDTISTWINTDVLQAADASVNSLTKYFIGRGDVMGGVVVLNPRRSLYHDLRTALRAEYEDSLWGENVILLDELSAGFPSRVRQINATTEAVCDWLKAHPRVQDVYYPKYQTRALYDAFRRPDGGFSGLFSLLLKDAPAKAPFFYNRLRFNKGPNLGTVFSLCCPFTMLAHYDELDWAEQCGVSRYLLRFSIGLEPADDLIQRLDEAMHAFA